MTEDDARRAGQAVIDSWPTYGARSKDDQFVIHDVLEQKRAWIVYFNTVRWVRTRDMLDMAIGSCPFVVDKATGELHQYGSGEYEAFSAWLD